MGIFDTLEFDPTFDKSLFGDTINISEGALALMNTQPSYLEDWQVEDIVTNPTITYYQNPLNPDITNILTHVSGIKNLSNTHVINYTTASAGANALFVVCNTALQSIQSFLDHTNRLSGLTPSPNTAMYPDLEMAMSIGRSLLMIVNKTDGIEDNTPILGSFTSLYVGDYVSSNNTIIHDDYIYLNSTVANNNTSISNSQVNQISANISILTSMLDARRSSDEAFYRNSVNTSLSIAKVNKFSVMGSLHSQMVDLIGTDDLKARLNQ